MSKSVRGKIDFEVLIDESFLNIVTDSTITPIDKKHVLSLINDFEDGNWRYKKFQSFIWDNITETALSLKERESLIDKSHSSLALAAKKLRLTDLSGDQRTQGSELAEIVLYGIMKHYYKALPVVPKIFHKQNAQDNAKGSDSVHIVLEGENDFSLWLGEAKFYNSIEDDRLGEVVDSIEEALNSDKLKKENSIITNILELEEYLSDKPYLKNKIKSLLNSDTSIDLLKPKLHIPILLLHECPITEKQNIISDNYIKELTEFHKLRAESYFKKQIKKISTSVFKYSEIHFHIILFPVPKKEPIVTKFVSNVTHFKNDN